MVGSELSALPMKGGTNTIIDAADGRTLCVHIRRPPHQDLHTTGYGDPDEVLPYGSGDEDHRPVCPRGNVTRCVRRDRPVDVRRYRTVGPVVDHDGACDDHDGARDDHDGACADHDRRPAAVDHDSCAAADHDRCPAELIV